MKHLRKLIAVALTVIFLLSLGMTVLADNPIAGDVVYIDTRTDAMNSETGKAYLTDTGGAYDYLTAREYNGNPCYCIEKGQVFTRTRYRAANMSNCAYWKSLTPAAREGIALTAAFGYPAQTPAQLGVASSHDAYVATQAIIWEYQQGFRSSPQNLTDERHHKTVVGTPAETAYTNILNKITTYSSDPRYMNDIQSTEGFVCLSSESGSIEQELICFYGKTPEFEEKGKIQIYKKDEYGNSLNGAEFFVYDFNGNKFATIKIRNGYGYADNVPFGTYTIVETKFPDGFKSDGSNSYQVTLNENTSNLTVTVNAVNKDKKGTITITKTGESLIGVKKQNISGFEVIVPLYGSAKQTGAVYGVYARDEIKTGGGIHKYSPNEKVGEIETDYKGDGSIGGLWLGNYYLKEIKAPAGHSLDTSEYDVVLRDDGYSDVITVHRDLTDTRRKVKLHLKKSFEQHSLMNVADAYKQCFFGIFNAEYMRIGGTEIPKGTLMGLMAVDENGNGNTLTADLPLGKYYLKEISVAEGYVMSDTEYPFEFTQSDASLQEIVINEGKPIENRLIKGSISVIKTDKEQTEIKLSGAVFELYYDSNDNGRFDDYADIKVGTLTESKKGIYAKDELVYGGYFLHESQAPVGYVCDEGYYYFNINSDGKAATAECGQYFENRKIRGNVSVSKTDSEDESRKLSGAIFKVYKDADGDKKFDSAKDTIMAELTETASGYYICNDLEYGGYFLFEEQPPKGYIADNDYHYFEITEHGKTVSITNSDGGFSNRQIKGNVEVLKVDKDYPENNLSGAKFEVYRDMNENSIYDADVDTFIEVMSEVSDGKFLLENLPYGKYLLFESKAPQGYVKDEEYYAFSIIADGVTVVVENKVGVGFENRKIKGNILILKKDSANGSVLAGAQFGLFDAYGNEIAVGVTDINGMLEFKDIAYGEYTVKEIKSKEGYLKNEIIYSAVISDEGETVELEITNKKIPEKPSIPRTGETAKFALAAVLCLLAFGVMLAETAYQYYKLKKRG